MRNFLFTAFFLFSFIFIGCKKETINSNPQDEDSITVTTDDYSSSEKSIDEKDGSNYNSVPSKHEGKVTHIISRDEEMNNKIRDYLSSKKECQEYEQSIREMTGGKYGLAYTFLPQTDKIVVKVGFDGADRFETYETYNYYPKTNKYTKIDIISGDEIPF